MIISDRPVFSDLWDEARDFYLSVMIFMFYQNLKPLSDENQARKFMHRSILKLCSLTFIVKIYATISEVLRHKFETNEFLKLQKNADFLIGPIAEDFWHCS